MAKISVPLNVRVDGRIVPSLASPDGARVDFSHIVVLDGLFGENERSGLWNQLVGESAAGQSLCAGGEVPKLKPEFPMHQAQGSHSKCDGPKPQVRPSAPAHSTSGGFQRLASTSLGPPQGSLPLQPPWDRWERKTADRAGLPGTWGLRSHVLDLLAWGQIPAAIEVQTRLSRLYPEYIIAHMPTDAIETHPQQGDGREGCDDVDGRAVAVQDAVVGHLPELHSTHADFMHEGHAGAACTSTEQHLPVAQYNVGPREQGSRSLASLPASPGSGSNKPSASAAAAPIEAPPAAASQGHCSAFLGNAAVHGDTFRWHVDADPSDFPVPSPWTDAYGQYCNREPGQPMFVSLLLYLDRDWPRDFAAETLFLDGDFDVGLAVRPKAYRAILMDQDVLHRVSAPSILAGQRPRFSLVWKLVFFPRSPHAPCCIARPEWGRPACMGSAAQVQKVITSMAGKRARDEVFHG